LNNASVQSLGAGETVHDIFNYTVSDGTATDIGSLDITITGTNDAPVLTPGIESIDDTINETSVLMYNLLDGDHANDVDGDSLSIVDVDSPVINISLGSGISYSGSLTVTELSAEAGEV